MDRAYSLLEVKSVDQSQRIIEGIASTPTPDRGGDSMDPAGAEFTLPMPLLWFHDDRNPIGQVFAADVRPDGIFIRARVSSVSAPGRLKTLVDEAWAAFTADPPLVRGLSIGWAPIEAKTVGKIRRVIRWVWGELSAVSVPMNTQATILSVKSADATAATGSPRSATVLPGATGSRSGIPMNTSEQLTAAKADLQIKSARLEELMADDQTHNGLEADEAKERDTLLTEIKSAQSRVSQWQTLEDAQRSLAVNVQTSTVPMSSRRSVTTESVKTVELPKGTLFIRAAMAIAAGKGSYSDTLAYAKRYNGQTPQVSDFVKSMWGHKAEEGTSVVQSPGWGGQLVNPSTIATEFVEMVNAESIIGKVQGFRRTPFNIPIITQTGGSTFEWVGESGVKPVGELAFTRDTLPHHKVAGIVVITEELIRLSTPSAEATVRRDLVEQCAVFLDEQFIQVGVSAGADNPASITQGVSSPSASGTTLAHLMADLNTAMGSLTAAGITLEGLVIVTTPEVALRLSLMVTSLGNQPSGFNLTPTGGTLLGYQVIVSNSVDADTLVIFKPSEIFLADDGQVSLDASNQATLDMSGSTTPTFSLWQRNCVGLRAERWITWKKRRPTVVAIIDTIAYVPGT